MQIGPATWESCGVLVLAGGMARRMGRDKLAESLGSASTVLDAVLAGIPSDADVVVVGPDRRTVRPVVLTREDPPGGGPAAAVAAGVRALVGSTAPDDWPTTVAVLAGDAPFAPAAVPGLLTALRRDPHAEVAVACAPDGHVQPLLAVYRTGALVRATAGDMSSRPARSLMDHLAVVRVAVAEEATLDVDTPTDLARARRTARARLRS